MRLRIAFDLDETLGTAVTDPSSLIGFNFRKGCSKLLDNLLQKKHDLILWTVSSRQYLDKVLNFGLGEYFQETYSWDEISGVWKDVRRINTDYLIDDDPYHKEMAEKQGVGEKYIVIPAYGSPDDQRFPLLWIEIIHQEISLTRRRMPAVS